MTSDNEPVERRKHKRFQVPTGSIVSFGPHSTVLGKIIDMSMGGLAFRYIAEGSANGLHLDIFLKEHNFYMGKVQFKIIGDFEIDNKVLYKISDGVVPRRRTIRRGSVQFGDLTRQQEAELGHFLQNYTLGEA
jgi:hypothetical protein